jgi:two-component system, OmpR family, sensor histidine kinase KdpD
VVYVSYPGLREAEETKLKGQLEEAKQLGAQIVVLDADDPVETLMEFARAHRDTQIFIGHTRRDHWWDRFVGGPIDRVIRAAEGIDVRIFPH